MKIYRLHTKQNLPVSLDAAWDFLSDPVNLRVITPPHMGFEILSGTEKRMYAGQIIQYYVTPIFGIKLKWVTEITHVNDKKYFVDEQRFGPYALWHHKHFIREIDGGVEMEDIVDYKLPLGFLGRIMHRLLVGRQLREIFKYREEKLTKLFGKHKGDDSKVIKMYG